MACTWTPARSSSTAAFRSSCNAEQDAAKVEAKKDPAKCRVKTVISLMRRHLKVRTKGLPEITSLATGCDNHNDSHLRVKRNTQLFYAVVNITL